MEKQFLKPSLIDKLHMKAEKTKSPINGTFELSPLCNMDCKMCYIKITKEEQESIAKLKTNEEWISIAEEAKKEGLLFLLLTGGEPFLVKDFKDLYIKLYKMGFYISINTNGTMINEDTVKWLKEYPPMKMNITLYGASNETYEKLCKNPNGFTQITKAISLLKENNIPISLNCSVTPYNKNDLKDIIDFAKQNDLRIKATSYMFPPLRKDKTLIGKNKRFTAQDASLYEAYTSLYMNGYDKFKDEIESGKLESYKVKNNVATEGEKMNCNAGITSFWISWDGKLLPCGMMPNEGLNPWKVGFKEAWENSKNIVEKIKLPIKCANCEKKIQCRVCAAIVYTETGTYNKEPQYRCDMIDSYPNKCKEILRELV